MKPKMPVRVTNIKLSFSYHEKILFDENKPILNYFSGLIRVVKFSSFTATLMSQDRFLNLTGIRNSYQILSSLKSLCDISNIIPSQIKYNIDSISAVFQLPKNYRSVILKSAAEFNLVVEVKIRFCGITIRCPFFKNAVCVYFQSGKCLLTAAKCFEDVELFAGYMISKFNANH